MIANKKHIIFDWNGTLVDDSWVFVDVLNSLLISRKLSRINEKKYKNLFCFPIKDFYSELGVDVSKNAFSLLEKQFIKEYTQRMFDANLFDVTVSVLKKLLDMGFTLSVLSASHQQILDQLINHYQLKEYFLHVVGVNNFGAYGKFNQGKRLMENLNYKYNELLYVGDMDQDYFIAKKLKISCILLSCGHQSRARLEKVTSNVVDSLDELFIL